MINEALSKILGWRTGHLLTEGFIVQCAGTPDSDGNMVRHPIAVLDDHLPNTQAHAVGNPEFTDDMWVIDSAQTSIDWNNPKCCICQQELAP